MKKLLNSIWNEFIYGGHVLALGAANIVFTSSVLLNSKITWDFLIIVYLGVYLVYLYNRYHEIDKDSLTNSQSVNHFKKYYKFSPLIVIACFIIIFAIQIYFRKELAALTSALMLALGIFYSLYLKKITKKIFAFKSIFVPLMWASLMLLWAIYYSFWPNHGLILVFIFIYLRIFTGVTFCDIKDIESDRIEGLKTFPIILGKNKTLLFLNIINILSLMPLILGVYLNLFPSFSLILSFTSIYAYYYINKLKNDNINISNFTQKVNYNENPLWLVYILIGLLLNKLL
jgi:4-hydroxybenzoate polyprenyltransferase